MHLLPKFEIYTQDKKKIGTFKLTETDPDTEELFMDADDLYNEYEFFKSKKILEKIIQKDPVYDEAYFLLAEIAREQGDALQAEKILSDGINFFKSIIPADFSGELPWGFGENRPYLRLLHELLLTYSQNRKTEKAIETGIQILNYNPDDNQGIRWLMGDLYLINENLKEAAKFLKQNVSQYPPLRYSYALLLYKENKKWDAITQLRLGFMENIYISEILLFKTPLIRYDVYETTNLSGLEVAGDYASSMAEYWLKHVDAVNFLQIIQKHPVVYGETNQVFNLLHELKTLSYHDVNFNSLEEPEYEVELRDVNLEFRKEIFEEINIIKDGVNKKSSKKILQDLDDIMKGN